MSPSLCWLRWMVLGVFGAAGCHQWRQVPFSLNAAACSIQQSPEGISVSVPGVSAVSVRIDAATFAPRIVEQRGCLLRSSGGQYQQRRSRSLQHGSEFVFVLPLRADDADMASLVCATLAPPGRLSYGAVASRLSALDADFVAIVGFSLHLEGTAAAARRLGNSQVIGLQIDKLHWRGEGWWVRAGRGSASATIAVRDGEPPEVSCHGGARVVRLASRVSIGGGIGGPAYGFVIIVPLSPGEEDLSFVRAASKDFGPVSGTTFLSIISGLASAKLYAVALIPDLDQDGR